MFSKKVLVIYTLIFNYLKITESHRRMLTQDSKEFTDQQWKRPLNLKRLKYEPIAGFDYSDQELEKLKLWKDGIIPYYIDTYSFDKVLRDRIRSFLLKVSRQTGLQFSELPVPPENEKERWVLFVNRVGHLKCPDYTYKNLTNEGVQRVVLGYDCLSGRDPALAATVLALAGVPPQHIAPDRDQHVEIFMDNILPEKRHLFEPLKNDEWLFHELPYDFTSAGHFSFFKYSSNGSKTILPKENFGKIKAGKGLSIIDQVKLKMLYSYIAKKKPTRLTATCSKLFRPSANINKIPLPKNQNLKPRKKPDKYTGTKSDVNEKGKESSFIEEPKEKLAAIEPNIKEKSVTPFKNLPKSGTIVGTITSNKLANLSDYISSDDSY